MSVEAEFYEQSALWTHDVDDERVRLRAHQLVALLPEGTTSILDVGTGNGKVAHPLQSILGSDVSIVGLDRSHEALQQVRLPRLHASADALPVAGKSFDVVTTCELLEHLPENIFQETLKELGRVARHAVVITVPNRERRRLAQIDCEACGCRYNRRRHLRSFDAKTMTDLIPGFVMTESVEFGHTTRRYPRLLRQTLERRGMVSVHDAPSCPQCGTPHGRRRSDAALSDTELADEVDRYHALRTKLPGQSSPYWLGARFEATDRRRGSSAL